MSQFSLIHDLYGRRSSLVVPSSHAQLIPPEILQWGLPPFPPGGFLRSRLRAILWWALWTSKHMHRCHKMPIGGSEMARLPTRESDNPLKVSISRSDSEKRASFTMRFLDFHLFSSAYQFPWFSQHCPSICESKVIAIQWFTDHGGWLACLSGNESLRPADRAWWHTIWSSEDICPSGALDLKDFGWLICPRIPKIIYLWRVPAVSVVGERSIDRADS